MIARQAGLTYVNSGNFYRAITYVVLRRGFDPADTGEVIRAARESTIELRDGRIFVDGQDVEDDLHSDQIDRWVAGHSAIPEVREVVNRHLRLAARERDVIIEGRDIATVVFPDARLKIYLDASIQVRARRRFEQGVSRLSLAELEKSIEKRDEIDRTKAHGSLRRTVDAFYLDTSDLTIEQVCEKVVSKIRKTT